MTHRRFHLWHSLLGTLVLVLIELFVLRLPAIGSLRESLILLIAALGAFINIYVATEVVEEVRGRNHMFLILTIVVTQFILFFGFEYWFLTLVQPGAFPTLGTDALSFLLNSVMVFVFNPIHLPETMAARGLLLIDTFGALGLVLFVLQNIGQFRRKSLDA